MSIHCAALPLCHARHSQLLIVDAQERLAAHMPKDDLSVAVDNINRLIETAKLLDIPIINTEQNPKGLGSTLKEVYGNLPERTTFTDKTSFSCCTAAGFERSLTEDEDRKQVVMVGMESHICILQTAAGLQHWGYQVFVVADAVVSRTPANRDNALVRMRSCGIQVASAESVAFEWLADSSHANFREISRLFK